MRWYTPEYTGPSNDEIDHTCVYILCTNNVKIYCYYTAILVQSDFNYPVVWIAIDLIDRERIERGILREMNEQAGSCCCQTTTKGKWLSLPLFAVEIE